MGTPRALVCGSTSFGNAVSTPLPRSLSLLRLFHPAHPCPSFPRPPNTSRSPFQLVRFDSTINLLVRPLALIDMQLTLVHLLCLSTMASTLHASNQGLALPARGRAQRHRPECHDDPRRFVVANPCAMSGSSSTSKFEETPRPGEGTPRRGAAQAARCVARGTGSRR